MYSGVSPASPISVAIIGGGLGGLSFGIALKREFGFKNFTIFEKASDVGGTWRDNIYPGCASDIPVHFYSLSTDLNPYWEKTHGTQPALQSYWKHLADKYTLLQHTVFNAEVLSAEWDAGLQLYSLVVCDVPSGQIKIVQAQVVVAAIGIFGEPTIPEDLAKGVKNFGGESFHSARWRYDVKLTGKRVAVVGNGCSSAQFIPIISGDPTVQVVNFFRTPTWYEPRPHKAFPPFLKWIFAHVPLIMRLYRTGLWFMSDCMWLFLRFKVLRLIYIKYIKSNMIKFMPPEHLDKLVPAFEPGCKRIIVSPDYLPALRRSNVTLNWDGIKDIGKEGIITKKEETIAFDVIIFATGFTTSTYPLNVHGVSGETIQEYFDSKGGPTAYLGTTVPGFPNFYMIAGPNTVTGHSSVIFTEEVQINYALQLIKPLIDGTARSFEVLPSAADAYNALIQSRLRTSVWAQCASWYRAGGAQSGKVFSVFPGPVCLFWWYLRKPDWKHYKIVGEVATGRSGSWFVGAALGLVVSVGLVFWNWKDTSLDL